MTTISLDKRRHAIRELRHSGIHLRPDVSWEAKLVYITALLIAKHGRFDSDQILAAMNDQSTHEAAVQVYLAAGGPVLDD